jgi:uncharacterized protein with PQ loop repeat
MKIVSFVEATFGNLLDGALLALSSYMIIGQRLYQQRSKKAIAVFCFCFFVVGLGIFRLAGKLVGQVHSESCSHIPAAIGNSDLSDDM